MVDEPNDGNALAPEPTDSQNALVSQVVFVKDIGDQFRIRIGASGARMVDTATQIWGPFDTETKERLGRC
jgi:hypothetical protein